MTLIEVLVAFVILSLALSVIMQIFSGGLRNASVTAGYTRALFLAESRLAAAGAEEPLAAGETSGQVGDDMQWQVSVTPDAGAGDPDKLLMAVRLYQVLVRVTWQDGAHRRQIELASLRIGPK